MPTPGLSLVGFMDEPLALNYLRMVCVPADGTNEALLRERDSARAALGDPIPNCGSPRIDTVPAEHEQYVNELMNGVWSEVIRNEAWEVRLVEIDPLLAFQFHIDNARSDGIGSPLIAAPDLDVLLSLCLPQQPDSIPYSYNVVGQTVELISQNINFRVHNRGLLSSEPNQPPQFAGVHYGASMPLTQVVRCNGRYYLRNGFHRAYKIRRAGAVFMPCIFTERDDYQFLGLNPGGTFLPDLLESDAPPAVGHYTQGRAHPVQLRAIARVVRVTWTEEVVALE